MEQLSFLLYDFTVTKGVVILVLPIGYRHIARTVAPFRLSALPSPTTLSLSSTPSWYHFRWVFPVCYFLFSLQPPCFRVKSELLMSLIWSPALYFVLTELANSAICAFNISFSDLDFLSHFLVCRDLHPSYCPRCLSLRFHYRFSHRDILPWRRCAVS